MPLRAKTPPPPQDEIFMTIFYPYPQHANMEVEEDVESLARWLGSIVPPVHFRAFYHKPSARNTVIIEVAKTIGDDKRKLLGQHTWKDMLLDPSEGEKRHMSGIFYCIFNSIRDVQKEGWKRIDFEDVWFMPKDGRKHTSLYYDQAEWDRMVKEEGKFRLPYPLSKRCEVPMEDPTNRGFCRPLPVDLFPIPVLPEMPREVPGTLAWTNVKARPESEWAKSTSKATKEKGQPNDQRGRTAAPRNKNVGPPVPPKQSGVNHKSPGTLPPNLVTNGKGKGKEKETDKPSLDLDELVAHTVAMDLDGEEEDQEYHGAGLENVLASAGIVTSPALPHSDHDPLDHTGVGVHVSGVFTKPIEVENSLWGDPLEEMNKKRKKDDDILLCDLHGKVCSRGVCKVYGKQYREQQQKKSKELKDSQEPQNWRNGTGGPNGGRGGRGGRGAGRGTRGAPLRGRGGFGRDSGPRSPRDENAAPRNANGVVPPKNAWSKPDSNPKGNTAWGADNNGWSPSEMGESAKPNGKSNSNPSAGGDSGEEVSGGTWDPPAAKDCQSQSEIGGSSQAGPWSKPGEVGNKPKGKKIGRGETRSSNPVGREAPLKSPVNSAWGKTEGAKDWTPSEVGMDDSVSQRGGGFRTAPSMEPGKKSWADQVEDEMDYASGDEPAPMFAPAPGLEGDGSGGDDRWVESGKGKAKAKGKAKSATGWSDVTNEGFW